MHIKEAIIRMDFMEEAINEWSMLSVKQKMYITYLLRSNRKYSNPNNSHLLYAIGATDEKPNGYVKRTGGGLCDIDIDFCRDRRNEVMAYVINKYGADKVAQIGTYATFKPRGSLRSFARVLEHSQSVGDELAAMVPPNVAGKTLTFDEVIEAEPKILKTQYQDVVDLARAAEGLVSQAGIHAAGVVISDKPLTDYVPLFCGKHDEVATQFDMHGVEEVGLVKYDFLGLKNLTVIQDTINMIKTLHGVEVDISTIDPDDQEVFKKVFQRGNLAGVFQFETSSGFRDLCIKVRPESIDDLSVVTALFRPGPLQTGLTQQYVDGRNGKDVTYLIPELEPSLKSTYGVMCIAEDTMIRTAIAQSKIQDINVGDLVLTDDSTYQKVIAKYDNGIRETIKIRTSHGEDIICTSDHKILTSDGWKEASSICRNDLVVAHWTANQSDNTDQNSRDWLIGLSIADGDLTGSTVTIACSDKEFAEKVCEIARIEFGLENCRVYFGTRCWYASLGHNTNGFAKHRKNPFNERLRELGLKNKGCHEKRLPKNASLSMIAGLLEGDGNLSNNRLHISNRELAYDVYLALQSFRINSSYHEETDGSFTTTFSDINGRIPFRIKRQQHRPSAQYIPRKELITHIDRLYPGKRNRYPKNIDITLIKNIRRSKCNYITESIAERFRYSTTQKYARVLSIKDGGQRHVWDLAVEHNHSFVANGHVVHNCFQEQIMRICTEVAGYTLAEADNMRKIIGKKLPDKMKLERDKFVGGCIKNNIEESKATQLFDDIEGFAKYSFNKTVDKDTIVDTIDGAKRIEDCIPGDIVFSMSESGHVEQSEVIALHDHGIVPMWEVQFDDGTIEKCTLDHKWLTSSGQISLAAIIQKGKSVWGSVRKVSGSLGSYEQLPRVYRSSRRKNNKGWPSYFMGMYRMWSSLREQEKTNSTSPFMRDLQNESYKRSTFEKKNNNVVWRRNMGQSRKERSPGHMSRMSKHIKSHQTENMCLHSTYCGYEKDIFRDSEKNSKTTRDNPGPFCCISKMETRKSGEVERIYRAGTKSIKEIKSRNIPRADLRYDGIQKKLPNQMQGKQKTSRFSEYRQPNNNRDRRPLAFFSYSWARRTRENTSKRQNVRQGNNRTKDVETNTTINRSLQSKDRRSQIPNTKLSGYNSRQNMEWHSLERKVVRATFIGFCQGYDLEVDHPEHNYLLSSGLCCSNSHSVAYSVISYQTAWLKTHYPIEFYCALFNCSLDSQDDLVKYFHASKDDGIEICPPNVNISEPKFTIKNGAIVFGLAGVKGLGEKACEAIVAQRPAEGFQSIDHMIQCGVNRGAIKALAACGALSEISDVPRMSLIYNIEALMKYFEKLSNWEERERSIAQRMEEIRLAVEAGQKPPRRLPKNKDKPEMPELMDVPPAEHKDKTTLERETLGFYLTGHPMDNYPGLSRLARYSIQELKEGKAYDGEKITIPAVIFSLSERRTRNDQNMAVIIIEDGGARMEATIFPKQWKKLKSVVTEDTVNIIDGIVRVVEVDNDAEPMVRIIVNNVRPVSKDAEGGRIEPIKIGLKDGTGIEFIPAKDQNYSAYQQALALVANTQRMGY
jgi:hypothetical protein